MPDLIPSSKSSPRWSGSGVDAKPNMLGLDGQPSPRYLDLTCVKSKVAWI